MQAACLGFHFLGSCQYDPEKPTTYFTIGQVVAIIALLVAFVGLAKPIVLFRLQTASVRLRTLYFLGGVVLFSVFLSAVLPFIPYKPWPLLGYPIFWEFLAGITFTYASIRFIKMAHTKSVFRKDNAQEYLDGCRNIIAKGDEDVLTGLAEEIEDSIRPAIIECRQYLESRRETKSGQKPPEPSKLTRTAFTLFEIWSDKEFCRCIVCKVPATAVKFFEQLRCELNETHLTYQIQPARAFSDQLLQQAFSNRNSILYREEHYSGLGLFMSFTKAAFADYKFVDGSYRPLQGWRRDGHAAEPWQVRRYADCVYIAMEALFREQLFNWTKTSLWAGLASLASDTLSHVVRFNRYRDQNPYETDCVQIAGHAADLFVNAIELARTHEREIPDYPAPIAQGYPRLGDGTIYGVIARGIFEFFDFLSHAEAHEDVLRDQVHPLWWKLFGDQVHAASTAIREIRARLVIELDLELNGNLDSERPTLPPITRLLIWLIGLREPAEIDNAMPGASFVRSFVDRLKKHIPTLNTKLVKNVLPSNVTYDQETNQLCMYDKGQEIGKLSLNTGLQGGL